MSSTLLKLKLLGTCIMSAVAKCFKKTHAEVTATPINPSFLYNIMRRSNGDLLNGKVQDAQEFWMRIIHTIENIKCCKDLKGLFLHNIISVIKCEICDCESEIDQETTAHVIEICKRNTIQEAINDYFSEQTVEDYVCPVCLQHSSKKKYFLKSAPQCLVLVLNRFDNALKKVTDPIKITDKLNLSGNTLTDGNIQLHYALVSSINHHGSKSSNGHYTAISYHGNTIYEFDDANVASVDSLNSSNAYILMYELRKVFFNLYLLLKIDLLNFTLLTKKFWVININK